jgi:hypothetical protein
MVETDQGVQLGVREALAKEVTEAVGGTALEDAIAARPTTRPAASTTTAPIGSGPAR